MRAKPVPSLKSLCAVYAHSAGEDACKIARLLMQKVDATIPAKDGNHFSRLLALHAPNVYRIYDLHLDKRHARYSALMQALAYTLRVPSVEGKRAYEWLNVGDMHVPTIILDRVTFRLYMRSVSALSSKLDA
jgi:hypothetical protein